MGTSSLPSPGQLNQYIILMAHLDPRTAEAILLLPKDLATSFALSLDANAGR